MDTRRSFIKKTALLSGALGVAQFLPASIQRALAIDPALNSTYLDAEHIVILMQENRSFDHAFGTLRGVRGFNDPRAITMADQNKVWLQAARNGDTFSPFHLDIKNTKITWMGSLPHGRESQMEAHNNGQHNNWIEAKREGGTYNNMPLTMGYYTREDIPFYYALADAFTICDQNFCSSLTGTDPNRLFFWSGTVRAKGDKDSRAFLQNGDVEAGVEWDTFPERLEQQGIAWKIYQNELSQDNGMSDEADSWLGNYGDNPLQYFNQYNANFTENYIAFLPIKIKKLKDEADALQTKLIGLTEVDISFKSLQKSLTHKMSALNSAEEEQQKCTAENFKKLSSFHQNIHRKAFATNTEDPYQHQLETLDYKDGHKKRKMQIPKGDLLHEFRKDVENKTLPTVSWLVPPENFSDHPSAPWFGSWYVSEVMDILTKDPATWKKTIFILAYDENDGYYDHVPPFTAADTADASTGAASSEINTDLEHTKLAADSPGPIGLGYRVPLVIASPWSRGGWVNSQVFDHTSTLQFLENFINKKFGKNINETNISDWRRTVCGNLTSVFREDDGIPFSSLPFLEKNNSIENIYKAKFKNVPDNYKILSQEEIVQINEQPHLSPYMPQQERGTKPSCALPYELSVDGRLNAATGTFDITMRVEKRFFNDAVGCPFIIYARGKALKIKNYALAAQSELVDKTLLTEFENEQYHLEVYGPNGFYRCFKGDKYDDSLQVNMAYEDGNATSKTKEPLATGSIILSFVNTDLQKNCGIKIVDNSYKNHAPLLKDIPQVTETETPTNCKLDFAKNGGWYDFSVFIDGNDFYEKRYAGRIETGKHSITDPLMGSMIS